LGASVFASAATASADERIDAEVAIATNEIVVKGQGLGAANHAFSVTALDERDIRESRVSEVQDLFQRVPGMNVRDYNLSGVANQIVIRGFANGGHGGDLGMVIDGIPLNEANSHADGYADANVLVPLEIADLTVFRGPVSALYGNFNRGGLITYETRKGGNYAEADVSLGEFDTVDLQGAIGFEPNSPGRFNGAIQYFRTDGYRPQSGAERLTLAGRYGMDVTDNFDVSVSARYQAAEGSSPAYLTFAQFEVAPYGIDSRVQNDGSKKHFATFRADMGYTIAPDTRLLGFAYTTQQDFVRYFSRGAADPAATWKQREERYDRSVYGGGLNLNGRVAAGRASIDYVLGVEAFSEDTQYKYFDDLDNRRRTTPAHFDRTLTLDSVSAFGQANVHFSPLLSLTLGLRYDRFSGNCEPDGAEASGEPCVRFQAMESLSPKIGVQSQVMPWLQLRGSFSQGSALPEAEAKFAAGAQGLDPNTIRQYEGGLRLTASDRFELDLAGYRIDSSSEFASPAPGEFVNFGKTRRTGLEASLRWHPTDAVDLRLVYARADSEVRRNLDPTLIGREVTGVPDHTLTIDGRVEPIPGLTLNAVFRYVGSYATDPLNTLYAPNYSIFNLGVSYDLSGALAVPARLYVDIENVGNVVYASSFNSLGSVATGQPRFVQVGVQIGF